MTAAIITTVQPLPVQWALDGITFGATDAAGCWWVVTKSDGWHGPPKPKTQRTAKAAGEGSFRAVAYRGERVIVLTGKTKCPTVAARLAAEDQLAAMAADPARVYDLAVTDQTGLTRTIGVELDAKSDVVVVGQHWLDWQLQFGCPDPRKHDQRWQQPQTGQPHSSVGGLDFSGGGLDFTAPGLDFGTPATPNPVQLANFGTAIAHPLFQVTGPATTPTITDLDTGGSVVFGGTLAYGDTLSINCDDFPAFGLPAQSCYVNTTSNRRSQLVLPGDWPQLGASEVHTYVLTEASGTGQAVLTAMIRSAWF